MPAVENGGTLPYQRADLPVEERGKDLSGRMTFEEKARLHVQFAATQWGGLQKGIRSKQALKLALAERYVQGVSPRKVSAIVEQLCGCEVSFTPVSQCAAQLDTELESGRTRPLQSCRSVFLNARYEKVRQGGQVLDCAVLIALVVRPDGKRSMPGSRKSSPRTPRPPPK
jgi:transposase-like protein